MVVLLHANVGWWLLRKSDTTYLVSSTSCCWSGDFVTLLKSSWSTTLIHWIKVLILLSLRGSWLKFVKNVNKLTLIESVVILEIVALSILSDACTCHTHTLSSCLVVASASKMTIVSILVLLSATSEDKTVMLHLVFLLRLFHDCSSLEGWLEFTKATVLVIKLIVVPRWAIFLDYFFHLCFHHLHLDIHPLHLAIIVFS